MASILKEAYNYYSRIISKELVSLQRCPMPWMYMPWKVCRKVKTKR